MSAARNTGYTRLQERTYASLTAYAVLQAYYRGLIYCPYNEFVTEDEERLIEFILKKAVYSLESSCEMQFFGCFFPNWAQHEIVERRAGTAYDQHTVARKLFVRDQIKKAVQEGVEQIVILGGGFDPRAYLTAGEEENEQVQFFELDCGATRETKIRVLKNFEALKSNHGNQTQGLFSVNPIVKLQPNLTFIECDFIKARLSATLEKSEDYDSSKKTLFIAEGLTSYLAPEEIKSFFTLLKDFLVEKRDKLLVTFVPDLQHPAQNSLEECGEPYQFALSLEGVIEFAREYGFVVEGKKLHADLLRDIGEENGADQHEADKEMTKCHFFIFARDDHPALIYTAIDQVPDQELTLTKMREVAPSSCCTIL